MSRKRKETGQSWWAAGSVPYIAIGVPSRWLWCLVSVSVRSLTGCKAHTGQVDGTGYECEVMRGDARRWLAGTV